MPTIVFAMLQARRAGTPTPSASACDTQDSEDQFDEQFEDQVRERVDKAFARELPDVIDHATRVFPLPGELIGALGRGYYIIAAVRVEQETPTLNERLDVGQRVENTVRCALGAICGELLVERLNIESEAEAELRAVIRWGGSRERRG